MLGGPRLKQVQGRVIEKDYDFVTNLRTRAQLEVVAAIHELSFIELISSSEVTTAKRIELQSNIYDANFIGADKLMVSNNLMPVRIFDAGDQKHIHSFYDRKPNSELFLTPLQISSKNGRVVGGGQRFMSCYDCQKGKASHVRAMDKKYVSAVQFVGDSVVTGQFDGSLEVVDLGSGEIVHSMRPHMDLVARVQAVQQREHCFVSLARKDNICYFWDLRNPGRFVSCFEHPRFGNQRTGLQVSADGNWLFLGGEEGQIFIHSLREQETAEATFNTGANKCVSSLCLSKGNLFCGAGERVFPFEGQQKQPQNVLLLLGLQVE